MLKVIEVVFDGKTFVPTEPVDLPTGTKASVELPERAVYGVSAGPPPSPLTDEQKADWERLCGIWAVTPLPWATVDEAVAAMRRPSWPLPPEDSP
jgi:Protein of unknown function DUF104